MRAFGSCLVLSSMVLVASTTAATTYTATPLWNSTNGFANLIGLNNKGQVLGDACDFVGGFLYCYGTHRYPGVWSNGVLTPLPIPSGYSYIAQPAYYGINDSGTVVGTLGVTGGSNSNVVVWKNGVPSILPHASLPGACAGTGCTCPAPFAFVQSQSFGINGAGHIVGATTYTLTGGRVGQGCSSYWVYDGASFRLLPVPIPGVCKSLPPGYYPGVGVEFGAAINDADIVVQTLQNFFCGPPFLPPPGFPGSDPFVIQTSNNTSFLPLGSLSSAVGTSINDIGDVLGYWSSGTGRVDVLVWDKNGMHDLGPSGYAHMNQTGQVIYWSSTSGIEMWQNGVSTNVSLPSGLLPGAYIPGEFNNAGQFTVAYGSVGYGTYLLTPSGPCAQDVTYQVQITRTGFRYNHSTGLFSLIGSITNTSGSSIPGPISLVVDNLSSNASLFGINGDTLCAAPQGSPYINVGSGGPLVPGASISGAVNFIDTAQTGITYNLRVLAGPGAR